VLCSDLLSLDRFRGVVLRALEAGPGRRGEARWVAGGWEQRGGGANRVVGDDAKGRSERERKKREQLMLGSINAD
jgi:hypothetical protein